MIDPVFTEEYKKHYRIPKNKKLVGIWALQFALPSSFKLNENFSINKDNILEYLSPEDQEILETLENVVLVRNLEFLYGAPHLIGTRNKTSAEIAEDEKIAKKRKIAAQRRRTAAALKKQREEEKERELLQKLKKKYEKDEIK